MPHNTNYTAKQNLIEEMEVTQGQMRLSENVRGLLENFDAFIQYKSGSTARRLGKILFALYTVRNEINASARVVVVPRASCLLDPQSIIHMWSEICTSYLHVSFSRLDVVYLFYPVS